MKRQVSVGMVIILVFAMLTGCGKASAYKMRQQESEDYEMLQQVMTSFTSAIVSTEFEGNIDAKSVQELKTNYAEVYEEMSTYLEKKPEEIENDFSSDACQGGTIAFLGIRNQVTMGYHTEIKVSVIKDGQTVVGQSGQKFEIE